jgi:hypothetical protein
MKLTDGQAVIARIALKTCLLRIGNADNELDGPLIEEMQDLLAALEGKPARKQKRKPRAMANPSQADRHEGDARW